MPRLPKTPAVSQKSAPAAKPAAASPVLAAPTEAPEVHSELDFHCTASQVSEVRGAIMDLEAQRLRMAAPAMETVRRINAEFAPTLRELEQREIAYKDALKAYLVHRTEELKKEAIERADQAIAAGNHMLAMELRNQATAIVLRASPPKTAAVSFARRTTAKVIDENLIPREYLRVDTTAINAAVRAGVTRIPGVSIQISYDARIKDAKGRTWKSIREAAGMPAHYNYDTRRHAWVANGNFADMDEEQLKLAAKAARGDDEEGGESDDA